ncbi:hypothetical protein HKBW3S42_00801 [Candidatus Hakubella thermalkaliphila]|uniref:Uncharacterized protein n=1 Tax=Candidatus Hakubella thermalkaliphila TaxID=2754717 RepID=A0A6V8PJR8_9ACTN|nr:hypothetical protein HKBW3S42_00801 [Candidatus Hakubella thermalkaliphila]
MEKIVSFTAEFLKDGHLSIPEQVVAALKLQKGEKVKAVIEAERFDQAGFLKLFGIWKSKSEEEVNLYGNIMKEREGFGRAEVKL